MSIQQVSAYRVGERVLPTIQEAQCYELGLLMDKICKDEELTLEKRADVVMALVDHTDEVVAILTCQPKAKAPRKPRKDRGTKRTPKDKATPPLFTA